MLFTLALVIGARRVLRGDNGVGLTLLVVLLNCVCLTNYVQIWEINCATFCGCWRGRRFSQCEVHRKWKIIHIEHAFYI